MTKDSLEEIEREIKAMIDLSYMEAVYGMSGDKQEADKFDEKIKTSLDKFLSTLPEKCLPIDREEFQKLLEKLVDEAESSRRYDDFGTDRQIEEAEQQVTGSIREIVDLVYGEKIKYKHNKTGNLYEKVGEGIDCTNARDGTKVVVYQKNGVLYVRELEEFNAKFTAQLPISLGWGETE